MFYYFFFKKFIKSKSPKKDFSYTESVSSTIKKLVYLFITKIKYSGQIDEKKKWEEYH